MKSVILLVIVLCSSFYSFSQNYVDNALLFSRTMPAGSARIQALGGAQVALGGDYSSAQSNPAGLGMYNRSEFTFTPGLTILNSKGSYFGSSENTSRSVFSVPGLSLVFHSPSERESGFLGGSFALSLTRINDFQQDFKYSGVNPNNSILDYFIDDAGDIDPSEMLIINGEPGSYFHSLTGLAYNNYLIEDRYDDNGNIYYNSILDFTSSTQTESSQRKGGQYQWSIAYGANFSDKVFVGANIGITTLRYKLSQVYSETNFAYPDATHQPASDFTIDETFDIRGSGVNATLGVIVRPVSFLQLGGSIVTPTYYNLTDKYSAAIASRWNNYDYFPDDTTDPPLNDVSEDFREPLVYEYNITTPFKARVGATFIQKIGFITTDVEFVNYGGAKYSSDVAGEFDLDNEGIKAEYKSVLNFGIGAEYRLDVWRLRAGYNKMQDPLVENGGRDRSLTTLSAGGGYRGRNFFVDLTAASASTKGGRTPYFVNNGTDPTAALSYNTLKFLITFGFTF
jgi:hypothetical protein